MTAKDYLAFFVEQIHSIAVAILYLWYHLLWKECAGFFSTLLLLFPISVCTPLAFGNVHIGKSRFE